MPFFQGSPANEQRLEEYKRYKCKEAYYTVLSKNIKNIPNYEICQKYHYSVGFYFLDGAFCKRQHSSSKKIIV